MAAETERQHQINVRLTASFALAYLSRTFGDETEEILAEMLEILKEQKPTHGPNVLRSQSRNRVVSGQSRRTPVPR